jgi:predicted AAA+ superfamily ATPase
VRRHIDALEIIYIVRRIPAWSNNLSRRVTAKPRVAFTDTGLAAHLVGMTLRRAEHPTGPLGSMVENFVLSELARQLTWAEEPVSLFHYRDRDGHEVDAILERASGEIVGIEVKAAESVRGDDFRGLRHLMETAGERFHAGYLLYCGTEVLRFGPKMRAVPISALWTMPSLQGAD